VLFAVVRGVRVAASDRVAHPFLTLPIPIRVPPLRARVGELPRIVDEYAVDAVAELSAREKGAGEARFTEADRRWVLESDPATLAEIEKDHPAAGRDPDVEDPVLCGGAARDGPGVAVAVGRPPEAAAG
jgi:hypothetical protein